MKKKAVFLSLSLLLMLVVNGCSYGPFKQFYQQVSPTTYPRTKTMMVFYYPHVDLQEIYNYIFSEYVIIGTANFVGRYYDPYDSTNYSSITAFGKSIGADVLICTALHSGTEITGTETTYKQATNNLTSATTQIVKNEKYEQRGIFLKNINNIIPLWNQTIADYQKTTSNTLEGIWTNKDFILELFQSNNQILGFINAHSPKKKNSKPGDLIFSINNETGQGIYILNHLPIPAKMNLNPNKFGFLELTLFPTNQIISFEREN